jgi:MG2 domain-containing protein
MIKYLLRAACFLYIINFIFNSEKLKAQNSVSNLEQLKSSFVSAVSERFEEKVFIHTDRSLYITGETIWLKPYCVDATFHTLSDISKIVNIELFDSGGRVVKQLRVQLQKGVGKGQIFISPDLATGTYILRAYTNWMKNFDSNFVFSRTITIINPSATSTVKTEDEIDSTFFHFDFFPEGGHLVQGLESKIAVKASDKFGDGLSLTGIVFDNEENEVAKFATSKNGLGSFQLTPVKGKTYRARIAFESEIYNADIPEAKNSGMVMTVRNNDIGDFDVRVNSTQDFLQAMYLVVHTRGVIKKFEPLYSGLEKNLIIELNSLEAGISHITILNSDFRPVTERLIFKYPNNENIFEVSANKKTFGKREKATVTIRTKQEALLIANASISVFRSHASLPIESNIVSYLLLTSDLKGNIPNAHEYFSQGNKDRSNQIDLVMLTNGWRRFDWNQIAMQNQPPLNFPAELHAPVISGNLVSSASHLRSQSLQFSLMGKASFLSTVEVDSGGVFHLEVPFRMKNDKVIISSNDSLSKNSVTLNSPFDFRFTPPQKFFPKLSAEFKSYAQTLSTNIQLSQFYRKYNFVNGIAVEHQNITSGFFGTPDHVYLLDEYTRFETVEDLFIEYIRFVYIKTKNKKRKFYVLSEAGYQVETLVTIDGVPIFDTEFILGFDPLKIEKISMISNTYFLGDAGYSSLLNFTTYNGDFGNQELPENLIELAYEAIQSPRQFYSPNYEVNGDRLERIPDYRNTLYWNSNISISDRNLQLEFYCSDDPGLYQIQVEGITEDGIPFFSVDYFSVTGESLIID